MTSAFAWIGQLMEWLGSLIPRIKLVRATHGGVKFACRWSRCVVTELKPGFHIYWPIITEIETIPVVRQTNNLAAQGLTTKDRKSVVLSGVVVYEICDVVLALSRNWDFNDTINDITMTAIAEVATAHTLDELMAGTELTRTARSKLRRYGVRVKSVALTDFSETSAHKVYAEGINAASLQT